MAARCASRSRTNAMPQSNGTLSHLWASVAHESASSTPCTRCRRAGLAAAQRPNAPSTCTHAPASRAAAHTSGIGSMPPPLTLPTCAITIAGPLPEASAVASASARIAPRSSVGTGSTAPVPRPRMRSARSTVTWRSSPVSTRIRGAPVSPSRSTSWPVSARTRWRAAARPVTCAIWQPVTSANEALSGSPSSSASQRPAISSKAAVAGVGSARPVFWSQAVASQSAAIPAGWAPPITNAKKRGELIAVSPGSASVASSAITRSTGTGASVSVSVTRSSAGVRAGRTGRSTTASSQSAARSATSCSSERVSIARL